MDNYKDNKYISDLIFKKLTGLASEEEIKVVEEWLKEDERNKDLYNDILNSDDLNKDFAVLRNINSQELWEKLAIKTNKSRSLLPQFMKWAAVFIFVTGIASLILLNNRDTAILDKSAERIAEIVPGSSKATLTVEGGKVFVLNKTQRAVVSNSNTLSFVDGDSTGLKYDRKSIPTEEVQMHTLDIPAGGEYCVTLVDGTKVWLNSKSRLKYPNLFKGNKRLVELVEGEAFFKVAKNKAKPFFVKAKNTIVKVTGTSFVVSAYKDDENISTSLVEGGVDFSIVTSNSKEIDRVSIMPGMKAIAGATSIETKKVNMDSETAWLKGRFVFQSERLEEILKRMSRWYNFEVFYLNNDVRDMVFTIDIRKYEKVDTFLDALENIGDVEFRMKNRTLVVTNK